MRLEMIGLSHLTSSLATRERAAIGPDRLPDVVARCKQDGRIEGVVVLSTCNRVEMYLSPIAHTPERDLRALFAEVCHLTDDEVAAAYVHRDEAAARHLFRVAAGLESQILGEMQILGQVKDAYETALHHASSCAFLNGLFLRAIECGKLVRARTGISRGAVSVAYAAIDMARRTLGHLSGRNILLIGAGDTIRLASRYIVDEGGAPCRVCNRTMDHAREVADMVQGTVVGFPPGENDIAWADIIVTATSSPDLVISRSLAERALQGRTVPLVILDLAVPRDVYPGVAEHPNVYLRTVDDFKDLVKANMLARRSEAERARELVEKQVHDLMIWYQENRIAPTIRQLQTVLEEIRSAEVANNARRFRAEDREQVDKFSKALIRRVGGLIIANMKKASLTQNDLSLALAVARVFALEDNDPGLLDTLEKLQHELSH